MATIDNKQIIDTLIRNNGLYPNEPGDEGTPDPRVVRVVEYTNAYNKVTWGIVYEHEQDKDRYNRETQYVRNPKTLWQFFPDSMR